MTRKDYALIASELGRSYAARNLGKAQLTVTLDALARALKADNPRFDWERFVMHACGQYDATQSAQES